MKALWQFFHVVLFVFQLSTKWNLNNLSNFDFGHLLQWNFFKTYGLFVKCKARWLQGKPLSHALSTLIAGYLLFLNRINVKARHKFCIESFYNENIYNFYRTLVDWLIGSIKCIVFSFHLQNYLFVERSFTSWWPSLWSKHYSQGCISSHFGRLVSQFCGTCRCNSH